MKETKWYSYYFGIDYGCGEGFVKANNRKQAAEIIMERDLYRPENKNEELYLEEVDFDKEDFFCFSWQE